MSHLIYCNPIWASTFKTYLQKLFSLQKRALKLCTPPKLSPIEPSNTFKLCHSLDIFQINKLELAKLMHSVHFKTVPPLIISLFSKNSEIHSHNTRNKNNFHSVLIKYTIIKLSYLTQAPEVWNNIPAQIKNYSAIHLFKKHLKHLYYQ